MSAEVTVIAPQTSRRPWRSCALSRGSSRSDARYTKIPTGTFTRKIQCQLSTSVRIPPSSTPIDPPPEATKPKTPMAFARSAGSVKSIIMSESETAETIAPPSPCTARAVTSITSPFESPQTIDATVKSTIPIRKSFRWP